MLKRYLIYILFFVLGILFQTQYHAYSQMLSTPNLNIQKAPKMSNADIDESYKQKIQSFITSRPTFALFSFFVEFRMEQNEKQGQPYTKEFKTAVIETAADKYVDVAYKYYLSTFGTMFSESEFEGITDFLRTDAGVRYAVHVAAVLLQNSPTLAPISKEELKKIDQYLVTFTGEKFKVYYPNILKQIQKPFVLYIDNWIEETFNNFNLQGKSQFKPLDATKE